LPPPGGARIPRASPEPERISLDRDEGTRGGGRIRADDRPPGRGLGLAGHPLGQPRIRRREAVLRPPRQTAGPAPGWIQSESSRRPDPRAMQRTPVQKRLTGNWLSQTGDWLRVFEVPVPILKRHLNDLGSL